MNKKFTILLIACNIFLNTNVFGGVSLCMNIINDKQLCNEIGQMLIIGFGGFGQDKESGKVLWDDINHVNFNKRSVIARHIAEDNIGGVILFERPFYNTTDGQFIRDRNIQNPAQVTKLNKDLQDYNDEVQLKQKVDSLPLFIAVDQEGGRVDRLPFYRGFPAATLLPQALGLKEEMANKKGSQEEKEAALKETYDYAKKIAQELSDLNFNLNFVPTVDININPTNPIIGGMGRSFSSDPKVVFDQAGKVIRAMHEYKIVTGIKHFPGHGSSSGDTHAGFVDVTKTYQKDKELYPYRKLIESSYDDMIMTTHVINGQIDKTQCKEGAKDDPNTWCPGTMSEVTLTKLLRKDMGFTGIIISDDMTMGAIVREDNTEEVQKIKIKDAIKRAINAGVDMFIFANNKDDKTDLVISAIAQLVKDGDVKREKIDEVYNRIVKFKKEKLMLIDVCS